MLLLLVDEDLHPVLFLQPRVRDLEADLLWSRIGLVPQKPFLFTGTVASNLRYGKPEATDEELWRALRVAQAEDFVREMPDQLEAPISQGGTNVSGGQRQRLAIARALVKRPEIYVFDDSFSALDVATDARLRAALKRETRGAAGSSSTTGRTVAGGPSWCSRTAKSSARYPRRAADRLPDVRRDRRLAAQRRGGRGVRSTRENASASLTISRGRNE